MALNEASENSVMAEPASDKVAPDGTGEASVFRLGLPADSRQVSFSSIRGCRPSKMPLSADLAKLNIG